VKLGQELAEPSGLGHAVGMLELISHYWAYPKGGYILYHTWTSNGPILQQWRWTYIERASWAIWAYRMGLDIHLTPPSKSRWKRRIRSIEFDQMKPMLLSSLGFSEKIGQLQLR
jgi:hypothetical protein